MKWDLSSFASPYYKKGRPPVDDIKKFYYDGMYLEDIESEIEYFQSCLDRWDDPDYQAEEDYDDKEQVENYLGVWETRLVDFRRAFEAQRPKIDYEDGSWE